MPEMRAELLINKYTRDYGVDIFYEADRIGEMRVLPKHIAVEIAARINCAVNAADLRKRADDEFKLATEHTSTNPLKAQWHDGRMTALRDTATRMEASNGRDE